MNYKIVNKLFFLLIVSLFCMLAFKTVAFASTSVSLNTTNSNLNLSENITFTANVTSSSSYLPTGTITFKDGGNTLNVAPLNAVTPTVSYKNWLSHPAVPTDFKIACDGGDCPVITWGNYSYWIYDDTDNNYLLGIVAYDAANHIVNQFNIQTGWPNQNRYIHHATIDEVNKTITLTGQGNVNTTISWDFLQNTNAQASYSISSLSPGSHSITAEYSGDENYPGSASAVVTQLVNKISPTVNLSSSNSAISYGQNVTYTAAVTSQAGVTPTGNITYMDGTIPIGTGVLSDGTATFSTSAFTAGSHNITAVYSGDLNYLTQTSSLLTQSVNKAATTLALSSSSNASSYLEKVIYTATISSSTTETLTGSITFKDGEIILGTAELADGTATFNTSDLTVGIHDITAEYAGNSNYSSTSKKLTQTVNKAATTISLSSSGNLTSYLQNITFTALVASTTFGTPTDSVTFMDGNLALGTVALNANGIATWTTSDLSVGTHNITAVYSGDTHYLGVNSSIVSHTVEKAATSIVLTTEFNLSNYQHNVIFSVAVTSANHAAPTGIVQLWDETTLVGTATLNSNGLATFNLNILALGTHNLTAVYLGDTNNKLSNSEVNQHWVIDLDFNHDNAIHIDDIIRLILEGTEEQKDVNHDHVFDDNDIRIMLQFLTSFAE